jgi:dihydropteroate synthase/2-amino-4-hydroxy-6-hydroxymethyldihydropteridine diphosphokinase
MGQIYLSLGTNIGDRLQNMRRAVRRLGQTLTITAVSPVYETAPWGEIDQPDFLNLCLEARTEKSPRALLKFLKQTETDLGREPTFRWGPRLIDIDILTYDDQIITEDNLTIPHPGLVDRAFVLAPLHDIALDWIHPQTGKNVTQMLAAVPEVTVRRLAEPLFEKDQSNDPGDSRPPFAWGARTYVMGIINATPDSFSGDGVLAREEAVATAVAQARQFVQDGADILDIGGESTRPGSQPIGEQEELDRILPVIKAVRQAVEVPISVDTYRSKVARAALDVGANWINDVWGLRMDPALADLAAEQGCPVILMHNRSRPKDIVQKEKLGGMFLGAKYNDLFADIIRELQGSIDLALAAGMANSQIIIDPGIGFGKSLAQNNQLINELQRLKVLGFPILLGSSRKSFIGYTLDLPPEERVEGTAVTIAIGIDRGADIVRVHDVKEMVRVARMTDAIVRET